MRLLARTKHLFTFCQLNGKPNKSVGQYLKGKKLSAAAANIPADDPEQLQQSHRLLYVPFFPAVIIALPIVYYIGDPTNILFNSSLNILQYYVSGVICFNSFFYPSLPHAAIKSSALLGIVAAANCITGPYSMATAVILGVLNFYAPFTDDKAHKFQTEAQENRVKAYMKAQALVYFMTAVLLTLRFYHYQEIKMLETKLNKFQSENREYFNPLTNNSS